MNKVGFDILSPQDVLELLRNVDLIVDGDYQQDKRLTTDTFMHEGWFIGSSNQRVIYCDETAKMNEQLKGCLSFVHADEYNEMMQSRSSCKSCGHSHGTVGQEFCSVKCMDRYRERIAFLNNEGIKVKEGVY